MSNNYEIITDNLNYKLLLFGDNVLYLAYFDGAEIDLQKIKEINTNGSKLVDHKPFHTVVNLRNVFGSMTDEAKTFVARDKELNDLRISEVLLVNSLPMRILTRAFLRINKPKTNTKIAKNIDEVFEILTDNKVDKQTINHLYKYLKEVANA